MALNDVLFLASITLSYITVIALYRLLGVNVLYVWCGVALILANIEVNKLVVVFGMTMTLGNVMYLTSDFVNSILNEYHTKKEARRAVFYSFIVAGLFVLFSQITMLFKPVQDSLAISDSMRDVFSVVPKVVLASMATYLIASLIDVSLYDFFKKKVFSKDTTLQLFFRSKCSSLISQFIDSLIFTTLVFGFDFGLILSTFFVKIFVQTFDFYFIKMAGGSGGKKRRFD